MGRGGVAAVAATMVLTQCANPPQPPAPVASPATTTVAPPAPPSVRPVTAAELGASWHPGCPVGPEQLRRVELTYEGFDGAPHRGELVVHQDRVGEIQQVFAELYRLRFPIAKMQLPQNYPDAQDELSMEDDNTSAFNCRGIPGSSSWSQHAYGRAVDVNPLLNPSVHQDGWLEPSTAERYRERARTDPGLLHDGDAAVRVFTDRGWTWGGQWRNPKDYQHFELPAPG
mgnify:CR=1 FL=1